MQKTPNLNERIKEAYRELMKNRESGEASFNSLLKVSPRDGFIYFERAKAYEVIGEHDLSNKNYQKAQILFPMKKWKDIAEEGKKRTRSMLNNLEEASHDPVIPFLPQNLKDSWNMTMAALDADPSGGCMQARVLLEKMIENLLRREGIESRRFPSLVQKIDALKNSLSSSSIALMQHVRKLGNEAAHGGEIYSDHADSIRSSLIGLAKILNSKDAAT